MTAIFTILLIFKNFILFLLPLKYKTNEKELPASICIHPHIFIQRDCPDNDIPFDRTGTCAAQQH